MFNQDDIKEHMEVLGSDGQHVGTVDHLARFQPIKLTKTDAKDGQHHLIPTDWVDHVDSTSISTSRARTPRRSGRPRPRLTVDRDHRTRRSPGFVLLARAERCYGWRRDHAARRAPDLPRCAHEIERACREASRDPAGVTLVAVSKTFDADAIEPVIAAGQRVFGENRVQEAKAKWPALLASARRASSCT